MGLEVRVDYKLGLLRPLNSLDKVAALARLAGSGAVHRPDLHLVNASRFQLADDHLALLSGSLVDAEPLLGITSVELLLLDVVAGDLAAVVVQRRLPHYACRPAAAVHQPHHARRARWRRRQPALDQRRGLARVALTSFVHGHDSEFVRGSLAQTGDPVSEIVNGFVVALHPPRSAVLQPLDVVSYYLAAAVVLGSGVGNCDRVDVDADGLGLAWRVRFSEQVLRY